MMKTCCFFELKISRANVRRFSVFSQYEPLCRLSEFSQNHSFFWKTLPISALSFVRFKPAKDFTVGTRFFSQFDKCLSTRRYQLSFFRFLQKKAKENKIDIHLNNSSPRIKVRTNFFFFVFFFTLMTIAEFVGHFNVP